MGRQMPRLLFGRGTAVTLPFSPLSRQRLQTVPGQRQLGRPRELLRVPGDPQRGGEAAMRLPGPPAEVVPATWLGASQVGEPEADGKALGTQAPVSRREAVPGGQADVRRPRSFLPSFYLLTGTGFHPFSTSST